MSQRYLLLPVLVEQQHRWDAFVSESSSGHLLQCWGWGELKASAGWHPLRLALWDTERQQMVAAAQILRRTFARLPLQAGHLAYIPKGPVLDWSNPALADIAPTFFSQLHMYLRKGGALALQVELPQQANEPGSDKTDQCMHTLHFQPVQAIQPLRTILLDLTLDEDTLLAQMKEKWRYNIRLAGRKGVRVRVARTIEEVRAWYTLLQTTAIRDDFGIHTLDYYLRAWRIFDPRNQARLFLAEYQGQLLAGIFVGLMAKQAIYLYCPTISCSGKPFAGRNARAQPPTTSGAFPQQMTKANLWPESIALKVDGVVRLYASSATMSISIVPWQCVS